MKTSTNCRFPARIRSSFKNCFRGRERHRPDLLRKSYYLEPEETGLKPFALLVKVLAHKNMMGLATIAIRNTEQRCALRAADGGLLVETPFYPDEIRQRDEDLPQTMINDRELAVTSSLVAALAEPFDPSTYHDRYREAVLTLIQSKTEGHAVVATEGAPSGPQAGDLMSALRASIEAARQRKHAAAGASGTSDPAPPAKAPRAGDHRPASKASRGRKKAAA